MQIRSRAMYATGFEKNYVHRCARNEIPHNNVATLVHFIFAQTKQQYIVGSTFIKS